jgi:hypothetical protein
MPLAPAVDRTPLHQRCIDLHGYRRADGAFDIEGRLVDTKGYDQPLLGSDRVVPAGEAVHDMSVRLTVSEQLVVLAVAASSDATPFAICPEAASTLQAVVGLRVGPGWTQAIKQRLGGVKSCTHLAEMLITMGTAAYQTVVPYNRLHGAETDGFQLEKKVDSCYAYAAGRDVVRHLKRMTKA